MQIVFQKTWLNYFLIYQNSFFLGDMQRTFPNHLIQKKWSLPWIGFPSNCEYYRSKLWLCLHLLEKSFTKIFCGWPVDCKSFCKKLDIQRTKYILIAYLLNILLNFKALHYMKSVRIRSLSGDYFPAFGMNTERYSVSPFLCVFSPDAGKWGPEKFRIRILFTQCSLGAPIKCH